MHRKSNTPSSAAAKPRDKGEMLVLWACWKYGPEFVLFVFRLAEMVARGEATKAEAIEVAEHERDRLRGLGRREA